MDELFYEFQLNLTRIVHDIEGWQTILELSRIRGDLDVWKPRAVARLKKLAEQLLKVVNEEEL